MVASVFFTVKIKHEKSVTPYENFAKLYALILFFKITFNVGCTDNRLQKKLILQHA